jgi:hypothetical protein
MTTSRTDTVTTLGSAAATGRPTRPPRDLRPFWRTGLAVLLPLPLLGLSLTYLLFPGTSRASFASELAAVTEHPGRMVLLAWLEVPFFLGMVPACLAVAWLCRRRAPVLATIAGVLTAAGFGGGFALLPHTDLASALAAGLDPAVLERVDDAGWAAPRAEVGIVLFLLGGVMAGLAMLGIALLRSRTAPWWAGLALILAGPTHPFMPNTLVSGLGLLLGAVGFAGVSWALLRSRDDDLDLPPVDRG